MNDEQRLWSILRSAMNAALERRAGLPRVTINDPPRRRRKVQTYTECNWYYGGECGCGRSHRAQPRPAKPEQLRLPLYGRP